MTETERWFRKFNATLEQILEVVKQILQAVNQRGQAHTFRLNLGPIGKRQLTQGMPMPPVTIADDQHDSITVTPLDAAGNEVAFTFTPANPVKWKSSDETVLTVSANADGSNVDVETTGKLGDVTITATGTNPDSTVVTGSQDFTVTTSVPQTFRLNVGTPQKR
jgi:hypothetical protein